MAIPQEPVGSLPRPQYLQAAYRAFDAGNASLSELHKIQDRAVEDSIHLMKATGQTVITDGEQRLSSFATYPLIDSLGCAGLSDNYGPGGVILAYFDDGHTRQLPRLMKGPFKYRSYAWAHLQKNKAAAGECLKLSVISPTLLYLLYPLDAQIPGYAIPQFVNDLVDECEKDIRGCLKAGAARVSIDWTDGRLAIKNDPRTPWTTLGLLDTFVNILNRVLDRFSAAERTNIGVHTCCGGDCDSAHSSAVPYHELLHQLLALDAGYFLIQCSKEKDRRRVYQEIGQKLRRDAKGVKQIAFIGVTSPVDCHVETPEEICEAILEAASSIPVDQLGATDDCGFSPFSDDTKPNHGNSDLAREIAFAKMKNRVLGVELASRELGLS